MRSLIKSLSGCGIVAAMLAALIGCAPKNANVRTPIEVEIAIRSAADAKTGSAAVITHKMAESLAAWRARCVAEAAGRTGRLIVTYEVEQGEFAPLLEQLTLPIVAKFQAAEPDLLVAAGLTLALPGDKDAVNVEIVLKTNCATGCKVQAQIEAAKLPDWHGTWNLVLTGQAPAHPDKLGKQ